jgi:DNA primase
VAGVGLSHPERLIYPEPRISKLDLAKYYDSIAQWILPHVRDRPLTLVHCPEGVTGACRYLRHAKAWGPTPLRRVKIQEKTKIAWEQLRHEPGRWTLPTVAQRLRRARVDPWADYWNKPPRISEMSIAALASA